MKSKNTIENEFIAVYTQQSIGGSHVKITLKREYFEALDQILIVLRLLLVLVTV